MSLLVTIALLSLFCASSVLARSPPLRNCEVNGVTRRHGDDYSKGCELCFCHDGTEMCIDKADSGLCPQNMMMEGCREVPNPERADGRNCCRLVVCDRMPASE